MALLSFAILITYIIYYTKKCGLLLVVGALGVVFYMLNKKFDEPVLFLEYWVFTYPYAILLIINF